MFFVSVACLAGLVVFVHFCSLFLTLCSQTQGQERERERERRKREKEKDERWRMGSWWMTSNLSFLCFVLFVCFLASFAFAAALSLFRATDSNIFIYNTLFHSRRLVPSFTPFSHSISQLLHFTSSSCSLFTVDIIF